LLEPDPHFELVAVVSVPSRLANVIGASSESAMSERYLPGWAGRSGVLPSMVSPTAVIVTPSAWAAPEEFSPPAAGTVGRVRRGIKQTNETIRARRTNTESTGPLRGRNRSKARGYTIGALPSL
jgi:hypothetical protein